MSATPSNFAQRIRAQLGDKVVGVHEWLGGTTVEILPENWLGVAQQLRDVEDFHFEQLIDVCGIDYLSYGQTEWDTTDVSATGFSRGVEGEGAGRFQWSDRPRVGPGHNRFAVAVQLLSIRNNRRVCIRCHAQDDALLGIDPHRSLDALVFSSPTSSWRDVMVAGRWVVRDGRHAAAATIAERFASALGELAS